MLKAERGDVVVFNNTSAEHSSTYEFSADCKEIVEKEYGIPFFWIEAQTYEDAKDGEWMRAPSYKLVQSAPASPENPDGYSWKGEVFEELISAQGFLPNQFKRICTTGMKLNPTRAFLKDWLTGKESIARLGHHGKESRVKIDKMYKVHQKNRGGVPLEIYKEKKEFLLGRPIFRPEQKYADFSKGYKKFTNKFMEKFRYGDEMFFGSHGNGAEYVAFIGLRGDEGHRVARVWDRNNGGTPKNGHEGENVYMPLHKMFIAREDVNEFWKKQKRKFTLPKTGISNCTYCFLKGAKVLRNTLETLSKEKPQPDPNTPHNIKWWVNIEKKYSRDLEAEKRTIRTKGDNKRIGFFGIGTKFTYELLADSNKTNQDLSEFTDSMLPCDCTE